MQILSYMQDGHRFLKVLEKVSVFSRTWKNENTSNREPNRCWILMEEGLVSP